MPMFSAFQGPPPYDTNRSANEIASINISRLFAFFRSSRYARSVDPDDIGTADAQRAAAGLAGRAQ